MRTIVIILSISLLASACHVNFRTVKGSGNLVKDTREVSGFTGIDAAGSIDVEVKTGGSYSVVVEADDNLQPYIVVRKEGRNLVIKMKQGVNLMTKDNMKVYVEMPELKSVDVAGSGNVTGQGLIETGDKIDIDVAGSGNVTLEVKTPAVSASTAGSGKTILKGQTKSFDGSIAGSGDIDAGDLKSEDASVSIAGSGSIKIFASLKLDVSIVGSGDVIYQGQPEISKSIIGSGEIKSGNQGQ